EDGIRDLIVTGVQTCALPISLFPDGRDSDDPAAKVARAKQWNPTTDDDTLPKPIAEILQRSLAADPAARYAEIREMRKEVDTLRSEERRVGKECRSRGVG